MLQSARASRALPLLSAPCCTSTQRRTIKSRHTRITPDKPAPWPYRDYGFSKIAMIYDGTLKRIDENSRIIVVEGNIGCGKVRAFSSRRSLSLCRLPQSKLANFNT